MNRLLSLFDYSGAWSAPFAEAGWDVIQWDLKISEFMDVNLIDSAETALDLFEHVDGIIAAIPCTEFTKAGNRYWKIKDEDGRTRKACELVAQVERIADLFKPTDPDYDGVFFWAVENPAGRIARLNPGLGKGTFFNPCEFAGYMDLTKKDIAKLDRIRKKKGIGVTTEEAAFILETNAYNKLTGLWGEFNRDLVRKPIEAVRACKEGSPVMRAGGKSDKTKEVRSNTPLGFSRAFYEANKDYRAHLIGV
jgi:hypothetical protein